MPGVHRVAVFAFVALFTVSACVQVAPAAPTSAPVSAAPSSTAGPTTEPVLEPTSEPASEPTLDPGTEPTLDPGTEPTEEAPPPEVETPTDAPPVVDPTDAPPEPTAPPDPEAKPNLNILEFGLRENEEVVPGAETDFRLKIFNIGSAPSGPFTIQVVNVEEGADDVVLDSETFDDSLEPGQSKDWLAFVFLTSQTSWNLVARVDPTDQIDESDESDNEKDLEVLTESDVNINVPADGLRIDPHPDQAGVYLCYFTLVNTGSATLKARVNMKVFGYDDNDTFVEWLSQSNDLDMAPNESTETVVAFAVAPMKYRAYFLIDSEDILVETNEADNEVSIYFTARN